MKKSLKLRAVVSPTLSSAGSYSKRRDHEVQWESSFQAT